MREILLEIDRQIKEAETLLGENEYSMSYKTKIEYKEAIADLKNIRKKMECKLEKLDKLFQLMTKV